MAVIAILAGILLPVLARSRDAAHKITCLNNLKQWAQGFALYTEDHEDNIPRESATPNGVSLENWSLVSHAQSHDVWYNALPATLGYRPAGEHFFIREEFYASKNLFHCPKARLKKNARLDNWVYFSVGMNSRLINGFVSTIRWPSVIQPSHTVLFLDNRLEDESKVHTGQDDFDLGQPSAYASRFSARHRGTGNIAFGDGHVENLHGSRVVDTVGSSRGRAIFPQTDIIWTPNPAMDPNFLF